MPDLNPLAFIPSPDLPPPVQFGFDVGISVRIVDDDGETILLDSTAEPASLVGILSRLSAEDLKPVIDQFAVPWLCQQRGVTLG